MFLHVLSFTFLRNNNSISKLKYEADLSQSGLQIRKGNGDKLGIIFLILCPLYVVTPH